MKEKCEMENDKIKFEDYEKRLNEVRDLKSLFEIWKETQDIEIDEIEEKLKDPKRSEGDVFEHDLYKCRGKNNENTISSHFVQFFYKNCSKNCSEIFDEIREKKPWKYVLKNAFNMDGCVGTFEIPNKGYKYIFLLKEANDSKKTCVKNYSIFLLEDENVNKWVKEWRDKNDEKESALMLEILRGAMGLYLNKSMSKEEFTETVAYMNINKRGGTVQTAGYDRRAVINYAEKYRRFILKQICLLAGEEQEVTVFVAGKTEDYFPPLMEALGAEEVADKKSYFIDTKDVGKIIHFINITHPSKPGITSKKLWEEMENKS